MKKIFIMAFVTIAFVSAKAQTRDTTVATSRGFSIVATIFTPTISTSIQKIQVQRSLLLLSGVTAVNIDLTGRQTNVTYNSAVCTKQLIKETIYNLHYSADEMHYYPPATDTLVRKAVN